MTRESEHSKSKRPVVRVEVIESIMVAGAGHSGLGRKQGCFRGCKQML